jgi:hypothetical protein
MHARMQISLTCFSVAVNVAWWINVYLLVVTAKMVNACVMVQSNAFERINIIIQFFFLVWNYKIYYRDRCILFNVHEIKSNLIIIKKNIYSTWLLVFPLVRRELTTLFVSNYKFVNIFPNIILQFTLKSENSTINIFFHQSMEWI